MNEYRFAVGPFMFSVLARTEEKAWNHAEHFVHAQSDAGWDVRVPDELGIEVARVYPAGHELTLEEAFEEEYDETVHG